MDIEFKQEGLAKVNNYLDRFPPQYHPIYISSFVVEAGSLREIPPTTKNETEILEKLNSALSYRISKDTTETVLSLLQEDRHERLLAYKEALLTSGRKRRNIIESIKTFLKQNEK